MSAANKKFQALNRQVIAWKAKDYQDDKSLKISDNFPSCRGTFDICPSEEELKNLSEKKMAPRRCGRCPVFLESPPKGIDAESQKLTPEEIEELQKVFGRKK